MPPLMKLTVPNSWRCCVSHSGCIVLCQLYPNDSSSTLLGLVTGQTTRHPDCCHNCVRNHCQVVSNDSCTLLVLLNRQSDNVIQLRTQLHQGCAAAVRWLSGWVRIMRECVHKVSRPSAQLQTVGATRILNSASGLCGCRFRPQAPVQCNTVFACS